MARQEVGHARRQHLVEPQLVEATLRAGFEAGWGLLDPFSLGRTKTVLTPVGTYSVHRLPPELFGGLEERNGERMATAEKAVFDTLYLARTRGQRFSHLTEIELPADFRPAVVDDWATKIGDRRVRSFVQARIADFLAPGRPLQHVGALRSPGDRASGPIACDTPPRCLGTVTTGRLVDLGQTF